MERAMIRVWFSIQISVICLVRLQPTYFVSTEHTPLPHLKVLLGINKHSTQLLEYMFLYVVTVLEKSDDCFFDLHLVHHQT